MQAAGFGVTILRAPRKRASAEVCFLLTIDYMEVRKGLRTGIQSGGSPPVSNLSSFLFADYYGCKLATDVRDGAFRVAAPGQCGRGDIRQSRD